MKRILAVIFLTFLASCTTFEDIDSGLDRMKGQHIDSLISIIGLPSGSQQIAGRKVYIWYTSQNVTTTTPVTTYDYGNANIYGNGGYAYGNYSGTSTTYVPTTTNYNCTIKVIVDRNERIVGHEFEGNIGGCMRYSERITAVLGSASENL